MIDTFLEQLGAGLRISRARRERIINEARDHLEVSVEALRRNGLDDDAAVAEAVRRFGAPQELARQFNAQAGTAAMRSRPRVGALAGLLVGVSFILGARASSHARLSDHAHLLVVIGFQVGIVSAQVALVAGLRLAARVLDRHDSTLASMADRQLVTTSSRLLAGSLSLSAVGLAVALGLVELQSSSTRTSALLAMGGIALGLLVAGTGMVRSCAPDRATAGPEETTGRPMSARGVFGLAERGVELIAAFPAVFVPLAAVAGGLAAMSHAETTVLGAVPWGVGEAVATVVGFAVLGPLLGLRRTDPVS